MKKQFLYITAFSIIIITCVSLINKNEIHKHSFFDCLNEEDATELVLEFDFSLMDQANEENKKQKATLHFPEGGKFNKIPIKIKKRGKSRRALCEIPPLKLSFSKKTFEKYGLKDGRSFKLVTHCKENLADKELVLKEYLAYQLYNTLSDRSFETRLVKIKYIDKAGKQESFTNYGFLIENADDLAERLEAKSIDLEANPLKGICKNHYKLFSLFQYMIGNTDWNLKKGHNLKIMTERDFPLPYPVPYDFDQSGLVNAPYARPYPSIPIANVQERIFQWRGSDKNFDGVLDIFKCRKKAIIQLCEDFEYLSVEARVEVILYLESFYDMIEGDRVEFLAGIES